MIFQNNFPIELFFKKKTPFSSLESMRVKNEGSELRTSTKEHNLSQF